MKVLSEMRLKILDFVTAFAEDNGYPPTVREICEAVGLRSPSTVHSHLKVLEEEGYLNKSGSKKRAIIVSSRPNYRAVPVVGTVTAGQPILAREEICGYVPYECADGAEVFALTVRGDSMINAGILEDDIVIVRRQPSALHGQIVVAMKGEEATVKRLFISKKEGVWLMPENPVYSPIDGSDCVILGLVVGLYRRKIV